MLASATLLAVSVQAQTAPKPTPAKATIDNGVLVGETKNGVNVFRGVPFAKPPIGALRWKAPQKLEKWPGERAAVANEPASRAAANAASSGSPPRACAMRPAT